jgi:hypothetical protein
MILINVVREQMKGVSICGVGKNVFRLEGLSQAIHPLEHWRRMKDKMLWPLTKVVMLAYYLDPFLPKKYKPFYIECLQT